MKNIKLISLVFGFLLTSFIAFYFIKQPTYTIQTEGILYVVNKLSSSLTVFDLFEGKQIKEVPLDIEPHEATVVKNPTRVVITNYGAPEVNGKSISIIEPENNTVVKTIDLGESSRPHGIIAMKDQNTVGVVTDIGNHLSIVDLDKGVVEKQIATQQDVSHLLVEHPTKPLVYVSNINSGSVSVIDIQLDSVMKIIPFTNKVEGIDLKPDSSELWVTNIKENFIAVVDTESYEIKHEIPTGKDPLRLKFSHDGQYCFVSNASDGTIYVYDTKSKEQIKTIDIPGKKNIIEKIVYRTPRPVGILMHPNGLYAFVSNYTAGRVEVIDMQNFTIVSSIKVGQMPDGLALVVK